MLPAVITGTARVHLTRIKKVEPIIVLVTHAGGVVDPCDTSPDYKDRPRKRAGMAHSR